MSKERSNLTIETTGIQGKAPRLKKSAGRATLTIDDFSSRISVDAFCGSGDTYKRRAKCRIEITGGSGSLFSGTFEQLCNHLSAMSHLSSLVRAYDSLGDEAIKTRIKLARELIRETAKLKQR